MTLQKLTLFDDSGEDSAVDDDNELRIRHEFSVPEGSKVSFSSCTEFEFTWLALYTVTFHYYYFIVYFIIYFLFFKVNFLMPSGVKCQKAKNTC